MTFADTDVLIDFLHGRDPGRSTVAAGIAGGDLVTTVISRFELLSGARTPAEWKRVQDLLEAVPSFPLGAEASDLAARISSSLARKGRPLGPADCMIAGVVLANEGSLLTRNRRDFERVEGLRLEPLAG